MTKQQTESASARKPRISPKQREANRANALRSTGPRTDEGKRRSALNALKHGILSTRAVNPDLDTPQECERFNTHRDRYFEVLLPQDQLQADLAEQIVINRWRMAKLVEFEDIEAWRPFYIISAESEAQVERRDIYLYNRLVHIGIEHPTVPPDSASSHIARYRSSLNNEYFRAIAELRRLKKERASEDGIYSVTPEGETEPEAEADDGINSVPTSEEQGENYQTKPNAESGSKDKEFSPTATEGQEPESEVEAAQPGAGGADRPPSAVKPA